MVDRQFNPQLRKAVWLAAAATLVLAGSLAAVRLNAEPSSPTFNADVAPILFDKCTACHRSDGGGPMSLTSYSEVRPWARSIKARVSKREMPPWSADARFGRFTNDISLSEQQIATIAKWVDAGMPQGGGSATALPKYPEGGWRLVNGRPPDVILEMPMEFAVPAEGQVPIFRLWEKNPFKEDVFVEALQIRPTNRAVTHHSAVYGRKLPEGTTLQKNVAWPGGPELSYVPTFSDGSILNIASGLGRPTSEFSRAQSIDADLVTTAVRAKAGEKVPVINKTPQPLEGDDERLMFYLPGADFQEFAPGSAKRIRASDALIWEVHYSPDGKPEKDIERMGLWLMPKDKVQQEVHVIRNGAGQHIVENQEIGAQPNLPPIPPGAADWKITAIQPFTQDVTVNTMQPHMHLRGKDMTYIAKYPDGHEEVLLSVPRYDFNWQNTYLPINPIRLPAGTVLETVGHYDNSVRNRQNPAPNRPAEWSEQTWDEMYNAFTEVTYDAVADAVLKGSELREATQLASKNNPITTVVGCVAPGSSPLVWRMTRGAKVPALPQTDDAIPVTHNVTKAEKEAVAKLAIGSDTFELIGVADFVGPELALNVDTRKALYPIERVNATGALQSNRRVAAKGVWIPGNPGRVNLTSVVVLSDTCGVSTANN